MRNGFLEATIPKEKGKEMNLDMNPTALVVFILLIIAGFWDLYCVVRKGTASSISAWIIKTTHISPVFTFVIGVIIGHLFFSMHVVCK